MKFPNPLERVKLIKRYKRFLADVEFDNGSVITVHTPNTGTMLGCAEPGSYIWIRNTHSQTRKYPYSWELSELETGHLVGVNTGMANQLVVEGIESGVIAELQGYAKLKTEVPYGEERSRIDIFLDESESQAPCYIEVKNTTARFDDAAAFPDAKTERGTKHLRELIKVVQAGKRAVIFFCVQRQDTQTFRPAHEIDPVYAETLKQAVEAGVEALAYQAKLTPEEVVLQTRLPVML